MSTNAFKWADLIAKLDQQDQAPVFAFSERTYTQARLHDKISKAANVFAYGDVISDAQANRKKSVDKVLKHLGLTPKDVNYKKLLQEPYYQYELQDCEIPFKKLNPTHRYVDYFNALQDESLSIENRTVKLERY